MATEDVTLDFTKNGIAEIAKIAAEVNSNIENIGARRLHTVMERLLDEISYAATDKGGETLKIDKFTYSSFGRFFKSRTLIAFAAALSSSIVTDDPSA